MLRSWRSVSSSWLDRLRISDRKFVNHTTEMILWSMILTSRGFLKSFVRSYGSNIIEAGTNQYWHKCNDVISHSLLTGNAQKYCCLKKYISIYICNYLCSVWCKSYSFGYCHTCCDIYSWCVQLDARTDTAVSNVVLKNNTRWRSSCLDFENPPRRPEFKAPSREKDHPPDRQSLQMACVALFKRWFRQQNRGLRGHWPSNQSGCMHSAMVSIQPRRQSGIASRPFG